MCQPVGATGEKTGIKKALDILSLDRTVSDTAQCRLNFHQRLEIQCATRTIALDGYVKPAGLGNQVNADSDFVRAGRNRRAVFRNPTVMLIGLLRHKFFEFGIGQASASLPLTMAAGAIAQLPRQ